MAAGRDEVMFEILLRSPASGRLPHVDNIDQFRPPPHEVERCRRWFAARGVLLHPTSFGLAGNTSKAIFETLFRARLEATGAGRGQPAFTVVTEPRAPHELADVIEQVTVSAEPELF